MEDIFVYIFIKCNNFLHYEKKDKLINTNDLKQTDSDIFSSAYLLEMCFFPLGQNISSI